MTSRRPIIVWGASGHALVVADILHLRNEFHILGFLDDIDRQRKGKRFCNSTVLGGREQLDLLFSEGVRHFIIGIGDCAARTRLAEIVKQKGFSLETAIHPQAVIASDAVLGAGTVISAGAVISPRVEIGENVIVNTSASVDHECVIANGVHLSPGLRLSGRVTVGCGSWIGIGAIVKENIRIGANSIVGAGAVVLNDIPDNVVAYGSPAQVIRRNQ